MYLLLEVLMLYLYVQFKLSLSRVIERDVVKMATVLKIVQSIHRTSVIGKTARTVNAFFTKRSYSLGKI